MRQQFEAAGYTDPIMVLEAIDVDPTDPPPVYARAVHVIYYGGKVTPAVRRCIAWIARELEV